MRARLMLLVTEALVLVPACGHTNRPEGVVERWLISLNQGKAGRPEVYASAQLSQTILPDWASRDPGDLDLIEVGKGNAVIVPGAFIQTATGCKVHWMVAREYFAVPFRVERLHGSTSSLIAILLKRAGEWHVVTLRPSSTFPDLRVPSEGGQRVGGASGALWLAALGVAFLLVLVSMVLMGTVSRRAVTRSA